jgi:CHAT domain-containing protein/tetratricopeptide (TPR) repeat protein
MDSKKIVALLFAPMLAWAEEKTLSDQVRRPARITTTIAGDYEPKALPDGRSVVYVSDRRGNPDIFLKFLPGSGEVGDYPLTFHTARDTSPTVSPTGEQIAFISYRSDGKGDLYLLDLKRADRIPEAIRRKISLRFGGLLSQPGGGSLADRLTKYLSKQESLTRLTDEKTGEGEPAWSPDGQTIYFTRTEMKGTNIYAVELLRGGTRQITHSGFASMAAPSPDGSFIAFISKGSVWVEKLSSNEPVQMTSGPLDSSPSWSQDGKRIYFSRYADDTNGDGKIDLTDNPSIYSILFSPKGPVDGDLIRLTPGDRYDLFPIEQNKKVIYASAESEGKGSANLFSVDAAGLFPMKTAAQLFTVAEELNTTEPRLAALALDEVARHSRKSADSSEALYRSGLVREALGDLTRALKNWEASRMGSDRQWSILSEVEELRVQVAHQRITTSKAIERLRQLSEEGRTDGLERAGARAKLEEARTWVKARNESNAISRYDEVVFRFPNQGDSAAQAILEKTELYRKFGDRRKLLSLWIDLLIKYPRVPPHSEQAADRLVDLLVKDASTPAAHDARLREIATEYHSIPILPALALNRLGDNLTGKKEFESALAVYRSMTAQFPNETLQVARAELSMARVQAEQGDYRQAFALFDRAEKKIPGPNPMKTQAKRRLIGNLLAKGNSELRSGDIKLAIRTFRDLIAYDPTLPQAHRGLVASYAADGDIRKAILIYDEERRKNPDYYLPTYALGLAYTYVEPAQTGFAQAEPLLVRAIDLNGRAVFPHQTLGFVYEKREELLKQPDYLERSIDQYLIAKSLSEPEEDLQNFGDLTLNVGNGYFLLQDYSKAFEAYEGRRKMSLPFQDPTQELVFWERISKSAFHIGRFAEAKEFSDRAAETLKSAEETRTMKPREILSHRAEIRDVQALALQEDGKRQEAAAAFREVAQIHAELNNGSNEAKALRNVAVNLFERRETDPQKREKELADARDLFDESLGLVAAHGVKTTRDRKVGSLLNISQDVSLGDDASEASKGFTKKGEQDLIYTFVGRIDRERNSPTDALAALDTKAKLLPAESAIDEAKRPAFLLKRSILANQRGILLARLGRHSEAALAFTESLRDAKIIQHETGMTVDVLALARLGDRNAPKEIDSVFEIVEKSPSDESARLMAKLALESESAQLMRRAADRLRKIPEPTLADRGLLLALDIDHFRISRHRTRREDDPSTFEAEAMSLGRDDLVLKVRLLDATPDAMKLLLDWMTAAPTVSLRPALPDVFPILHRWLDAAVETKNVEGAYNAAEWISRVQLELLPHPLPRHAKTAEAEALLTTLSEILTAYENAAPEEKNELRSAFSETLSQLEGLDRGLASFYRMSIVDAAELIEMLGDRGYVRTVETPKGVFQISIQTGKLSLTQSAAPSKGETYTTPGNVASAAHLFYSLNSRSIFNRRVYQFSGPGPEAKELIEFKTRPEFEKKLGLADIFVAPAPLEIPEMRWRLPVDGMSRYEREIPSSLLIGSGTSKLVLKENSPKLPLLWAEILARGGVSNVEAGPTFIGSRGFSPQERNAVAENLLNEKIAAGAQLYRAQRWNPTVRHFEEALEVLQAQDQPQVRDEVLDAASTAAFKGEDPDRAIRLAEQLVSLRRKSSHPKLADSLHFLGVLYSRADRFDESVRTLNEASQLFSRQKAAPKKLAESLSTIGIVMENAKKYGESLNYFDRSLQILGKSKSGTTQGEQWRRIGRIYYLRLNDNARAKDAFDKARIAFQKDRAVSLEDEAILELGLIEERGARFEEAREIYRGVYDRSAKRNEPSLQSKAALFIANTHWFTANYFEAFKWQSESLSLADKAKDDRMRLLARSTAGLIFWTLNEHSKAISEQERALELAQEIHSPLDVASAFNNLGLVYRDKGDLAQSINLFEKALAIDGELKSPWGKAYDHRNLGISLTRLNRFKEAEVHLKLAIQLSASIGDRVNEAKAHQNLGELQVTQKDWVGARPTLKKALSLARDAYLKEVEWRALWGLAKVSRAQKSDEEAAVYLKEAIDVVEGMSAEIKIEEFRNGFIANKLGLYEDMILLQLAKGKVGESEAWSYAERSRARSFIDLLGNKKVPVKTNVDRALVQKERDNRKAILDLENRVAASKNPEERKRLHSILETTRRARTDLMIEIRSKAPELSSFVSVDVLSLPELRRLIKNDTALVEYFVSEKALLIWIITHTDLEVVSVAIARHELETKMIRYSSLMQKGQPLSAESKDIHDIVWKPIEKYVKGSRFVGVSPHGTLHYLSFASLSNGEQYVVDRHNLFFTPSASVLKYTLAEKAIDKSNVQVLAIGNPDLGDPSLSLPFAEKEVSAIAWTFPHIDVLTGKKATERWVALNAGKYNVVHLASHGEFDAINPLFSAIKLAASENLSGNLVAEEIFDLKLNADLVTLSACQTGLAKIEGGDELIGLNRAFLYAGTHSILSSLWRVNDVSTAVLIKHFYRNYIRESKSESLRQAQLKVKDYYPHPSYWAAFFLTGDYR